MKDNHCEFAVIDAETDPFLHNRVPRPFAFGYFDGNEFSPFWGDDCVDAVVAYIRKKKPAYCYAHHGGKFDFMFLLPYLENPIRIINGRIAEARIGGTILRDSWCILPFALAQFDKGEVDYEIFEREQRDTPENKRTILNYLRRDCTSLHALIAAFRNRFGTKLTVASTAMGELRARHEYPNCGPDHDKRFRAFYFGGRVECFRPGKSRGKLKLYDVNSMYPHVMREFWHPRGAKYSRFDGEDFWSQVYGKSNCYFLTVTCRSMGVFARREKDGRLGFPRCEGTFQTTGHEFEEALRLGLIDRIGRLEAWQCEDRIKFDSFVDDFYRERLSHKGSNRALELACKTVLNSAYGKFAQNPRTHTDFHIRRPTEPFPAAEDGWEVACDYAGLGEIWERPVHPDRQRFYDVAIAASITGAARSVLMCAIHRSNRPIYCDTDSLICEDLPGELVHASDLGKWKCEAEFSEVFVGGKKLYACYKGKQLIKSSAKGIQKKELTKADWRNLIRGVEIESFNPAPNFKLDGSARFTTRRIRRTHEVQESP
jgi:hypothetical protein